MIGCLFLDGIAETLTDITPQKLDNRFKYIVSLSILKFKDQEKEYLSQIKIKGSY